MASGDILIRMGAVLIGGGELSIVLIPLGFALLWAVVTASNHFRAKQDEQVLQAARDYDIGGGVTLLQGVQAYFGCEGDWYVTSCSVYLFAGAPGGGRPRAAASIDVGTWTLTVSSFEPRFASADGGGPDALLPALIHAVKG